MMSTINKTNENIETVLYTFKIKKSSRIKANPQDSR